jgi:hypothetical protein
MRQNNLIILLVFFGLFISESSNLVFSQTIEYVKRQQQREQRKKERESKSYPDYFGIQYRPIIPINAFGAGPLALEDTMGVHNSLVSPEFGFSAGGVIRVGFSERFAIETGIHMVRRNYKTEYFVPDSSLFAETTIRNISYDIPVNFLIYVKVNNWLYINASFGNSFLFFPSNTATQTNTLPHNFRTESLMFRWIRMALNANAGVEFRTEKDGFFYIGASFHRPYNNLYAFRTTYQYKNDPVRAGGAMNGTFFSLDLKYFFPIIKSKGAPINPGPLGFGIN